MTARPRLFYRDFRSATTDGAVAMIDDWLRACDEVRLLSKPWTLAGFRVWIGRRDGQGAKPLLTRPQPLGTIMDSYRT